MLPHERAGASPSKSSFRKVNYKIKRLTHIAREPRKNFDVLLKLNEFEGSVSDMVEGGNDVKELFFLQAQPCTHKTGVAQHARAPSQEKPRDMCVLLVQRQRRWFLCE